MHLFIKSFNTLQSAITNIYLYVNEYRFCESGEEIENSELELLKPIEELV